MPKMTSGNGLVEAITSDPVVVEISDAENPESNVDAAAPVPEKTAEKEVPLENKIQKLVIDEVEYRRPVHRESAGVVYPRNYSRSRSPVYRRRQNIECAVLSSSATLNSALDETDACVETLKGQLVYITTHPFHSADLQKFSWLFTLGVPDGWSQKPTSFLAGNGFQFELPRGSLTRGQRTDYYDDDYDSRVYNPRGPPVPIARLGSALRIFKNDSDPEASKVKFVTAVQSKNDAVWVKLIVSHSRQAAVADIFHELLNNHTIVFVGAVLRNVAVPAENLNNKPRSLQRVGSVKEAEEVGQGVIGVIC